MCFCFFKQKTAYEMRSSDWSSDVCSSDLLNLRGLGPNRTLVLLNGHRLTPANTGSAPDINMLPQQLIKRVDLVTRSEEHTSELQSLMRISYAVFCLKKKKNK